MWKSKLSKTIINKDKETSKRVKELEVKVDQIVEKLDKLLREGICKANCPIKEI